MFFLFTKCHHVSTFGSKATTPNFHRHTNNNKYNTWGIEATAIPRLVKVQHVKEIAYVLTDSVSRLRAVGLYHDLDFRN